MPLIPAGYLPRIVDAQIERALQAFGAVCVEGPKWCGKTWASLAHAASAAIERQGARTPSVLAVVCGLTSFAYTRADGVAVVPITALRD